jgi:O-antigen/teichoic acid export membrane protein
MKDLLAKLFNSKMFRGTAVLWVGMMAANVSNYLFHLLMGRFLGPVNYGVLASIVSILYFLMVPTTTIAVTVMKFTAEYEIEGSPGKVRTLLVRLTKQLLAVSAVLFVAMAAASPFIASFLNMDSINPLLLVSGIVLVTYVVPINRGVLQGQQKFGQLSANLILETVIKLGVGIALVLAGYAVNGAVIGMVLGLAAAYAVSFIPLRKIFAETAEGNIALKEIFRYSVPVFIALMCLNSYYSVDIILVKHFLPAVQAGYYSGLSILGKIVVFASLAIVGVMFPIVAGRHKADETHGQILVYALGLVALVSGGIVLAYNIAPEMLIRILFGTKYLAVAPYLGEFGLAMLLLSLSSTLVNYYLAIDKTACVPLLTVIAVGQAAALWVWHGSLTQIVTVMMATMAALLISLVVFYFAAVRKSL